MELGPDNTYVIEVLPQHRKGRSRFYKAKSKGYTDVVWRAGVFHETEAMEIDRSNDRARAVKLLKVVTEDLRPMEEGTAAAVFAELGACAGIEGRIPTLHNFLMMAMGVVHAG